METIPGWLGAIGALFVMAAALGSAVAIYKTNLQGTSLRESERTIDRLRGEIADYERREQENEAEIRVHKIRLVAANDRITVLEDLITKRQDDDEIRAEIAAVRKVVDENVIAQLTSILTLLEANNGSGP